ncbi:serine hydrolase FSH [Aspergillus egyptiacus]|nr:serine hydrolase FSH [Aspergillus egyptiacus]
MKFICLPGRYSNSKTMAAQMGPLCQAMESDKVDFCFTQAPFPCKPPADFLEYFGAPPFYRWYAVAIPPEEERRLLDEHYRRGGDVQKSGDILREIFAGIKPEDFRLSCDSIRQAIDAEGDVEGIIGFSEGASMAATFLLDEQRRQKEEQGYQPRIRYAILFNGTPPLQLKDGKSELVMDPDTDTDTDTEISVRSLHVFCTTDPFLGATMDLYNAFDPETAELYDSGSGHLIPRDPQALQALREAILRTIRSD